jgi:uncharacterized damage-inducible protein DinB
MSNHLLEDLEMLYLREVTTLERELELYPDDKSVWKELPGLPNSGGTLLLHLAGSLQHFFGATLGKSGYVRDRAAEFSKRDAPRNEIKQELSKAKQGVKAGFATLTEERLGQVFPAHYADVEVSSQLTLLQFLSHLAYHLGQIDYHRRMVTGNSASANAIAASEFTDYIEHTKQGSV